MKNDLPAREGAEKLTREERLAAKLRENLRRRKAQARAVAGELSVTGGDSGRLPKSPPES
ncbi:hypothetical protein [Novosphingobium panipatense]|uniref:Uncharacterized protein n=1 Tax=Novosphingobium panipatense TaxID=428991 RepID=A0ABY1QDN7_9SPHN|nr:hypothetical protein [Novosphingobium panipatense]SMP67449.1 hypothetical protein SAMN06296065_104212 [Novosphingobium panipatense]